MITTAQELRALLERLFPAFRAELIGSYHTDGNGYFTPHGLCMEFSYFFSHNLTSLLPSEMAELFLIIETIVASDPEDRNPVANALCTCFLENIACTDEGEISRQFMGVVSRAYFDGWHASHDSGNRS